MRLSCLLAAVLASAVAAPAAARDKVSRTVEVRATVAGNLSSVYEPDPPPERTATGYYNTYTASWSWTQTETSTYRRRPARLGGEEYAQRTVTVTSATLNESSNIVVRAGQGPGDPVCETGGTNETVTDRRVEKGAGADIPNRRYPYTVVAGVHPDSCGGADHAASGSFPGAGLESICVWTCTLPAGRRAGGASVPTTEHNGLGQHVHSASYSASVVVSTQRAGKDKEVRHRWQADF
jgi:hypothetical protein